MAEELRGRSGPGRAIVEHEESLHAFRDLYLNEALARDMRTPPEHAAYPVSATALRTALKDESALIEARELLHAIGSARERAAARAKAAPAGQPTALEFLGRPYQFNRFLFCEPSDPDSFSNNRASGWDDAIALARLGRREGAGGSSSHGPDTGGPHGKPRHRRSASEYSPCSGGKAQVNFG